MKHDWVKLIRENRDEIEDTCTKAFEKAMCDTAKGDCRNTFAVVMDATGNARMDEYPNESMEAEDVWKGEAISITAYQYQSGWEDDWYEGKTEEEREALENETEEERQNHLDDYETWYESEGYIGEAVDRVLANWEDRQEQEMEAERK